MVLSRTLVKRAPDYQVQFCEDLLTIDAMRDKIHLSEREIWPPTPVKDLMFYSFESLCYRVITSPCDNIRVDILNDFAEHLVAQLSH